MAVDLSSSLWVAVSVSVSVVAFLKFFMAWPIPVPILGSFPTPNIIRMITRIIISSVVPMPNMETPQRAMGPLLQDCFIYVNRNIIHYR